MHMLRTKLKPLQQATRDMHMLRTKLKPLQQATGNMDNSEKWTEATSPVWSYLILINIQFRKLVEISFGLTQAPAQIHRFSLPCWTGNEILLRSSDLKDCRKIKL